MYENHQESKDTRPKNKQNAAYISQFHEASKDTKTKSKQNATNIRHFHASLKPSRSPLTADVTKYSSLSKANTPGKLQEVPTAFLESARSTMMRSDLNYTSNKPDLYL